MAQTDYRGTCRADRRKSPVVLLILASAFVVFGFSGVALATVSDTSATEPSITTAPPNTEAPGDTLSDDSVVPSDETLEEEDEGVDVAPIAIVGSILLIAIASWWMVRRDDIDDRPNPPPTGEPEWRADQIAP